MIQKYIFLIFFSLVICNFTLHFKIITIEKKISFLKDKKKFLNKSIQLSKINWAYIIRPENLDLLNKKRFGYVPIIIEDIINDKDI